MDNVSKKKRSEIMSKIRGKRTKPEILVHGWLKGLKVRHIMWPEMYGSPDILIYPKTVVFINGCFWHGCKKHFKCPKTNSEFWQGKIDNNKKRQHKVIANLQVKGWRVIIIWEHSLR